MKKVLLHVCCGVCAGWPIEKLRLDGYEVTCYFYNPNVAPRDEYERRCAAARQAAETQQCIFLEGEYDHGAWLNCVAGMENEPEGGRRCAVCFRHRLFAASAMARQVNADYFATTLTVSAHKNALVVNAIGSSLSSISYLPEDFKKKDGFRKTSQFARDHGLYRQDYCGCPFSRRSISSP
jgi:epoxyqueuosine reductase